ncbi:tripartite tricarboxylate transporter TctB family protein [Caldovatus sediminis]|uniref:tripartite tricarboxylate transporter TctB family protein n=1 Tax=Caldovatus sediminis TaxID=2041189 RepID=UPI0016679FAA|nr:tripartite tricarboxylate transporter TctB family protein [Caldovatus sediminis]
MGAGGGVARLAILLLLAGVVGALGWLSLGIAGGAGLYPRIVIGAALILLAATAVAELRRRPALGEADPELAALVSASGGGAGRTIGFLAVWLAHPLAMPVAGFLLATTAALAASLLLLGARRRWLAVLGACVFTLLLSLAMRLVIYVPVPAVGLDEALDRLLFALRAGRG